MRSGGSSIAVLLVIIMLLSLCGEVQGVSGAQEDPFSSGIRDAALYFLHVPVFKNIGDIYPYKRGGVSFGWVGGIIYVYQQFAFTAVPDEQANLYAALIMSQALSDQNFVKFSSSERSNLSLRVKSISKWLISERLPNGLWASDVSGRCVDTTYSSSAIKMLVYGRIAGVLEEDVDDVIMKALSEMISLQDRSGGWASQPDSPIPSRINPNPLHTARVLNSLLLAKRVGYYVSGMDSSIRRAVEYLQNSAVTSGNETYWSGSPMKDSEVASALAQAAMQGYSVNGRVLKGSAEFFKEALEEGYESTLIGKALLLTALIKLSALGVTDTYDILSSWSPLAETIARSRNSDGLPLYGVMPFLGMRCQETCTALTFLEWWLRASSVSLSVSFERGLLPGYTNVTVENSTVVLSVLVKNNLNTKPIELELMSTCSEVLSPLNKSNKATLDIGPAGGKQIHLVYSTPLKLLAPHPAYVLLTVKDPYSKTFLYSKYVSFEVVRNSNVRIVTVEIKDKTLNLDSSTTVTLSIENVGDVPATGIKIVEKLDPTFELVPETSLNGTALILETKEKGAFYIPALGPGRRLTYVYEVRAVSSPPGKNNVSTTILTYTDALGRVRSTRAVVCATVYRPLLSLTSMGSSSLQLEWGSTYNLKWEVRNTGNAPAKNISVKFSPGEALSIKSVEGYPYTVEPDGSVHVVIGDLKQMESKEVVLKVKASDFYPSVSTPSYISADMTYKDNLGRFLKGYEVTHMVNIKVVISTFAVILMVLSTAIAAGLVILRLRIRSRTVKRTSPFVRKKKAFGGRRKGWP